MGKNGPKIIIVVVCLAAAAALLVYSMGGGGANQVSEDGIVGQTTEEAAQANEKKVKDGDVPNELGGLAPDPF